MENVTKKYFDDLLASPSQAHSMNTQQRLHYIEQHHNRKHERERSMDLKPFNKWNSYGRRITEETRKRPRMSWSEGIAKLQEKKIESDGQSATSAAAAATPTTSVGYGSLSGTFMDSLELFVSNFFFL